MIEADQPLQEEEEEEEEEEEIKEEKEEKKGANKWINRLVSKQGSKEEKITHEWIKISWQIEGIKNWKERRSEGQERVEKKKEKVKEQLIEIGPK